MPLYKTDKKPWITVANKVFGPFGLRCWLNYDISAVMLVSSNEKIPPKEK